jgi:hypothetical protein
MSDLFQCIDDMDADVRPIVFSKTEKLNAVHSIICISYGDLELGCVLPRSTTIVNGGKADRSSGKQSSGYRG